MKTIAPPSTRQRSTLITNLLVALLLVAALPFALAAFQIRQARESLVQQAQQTHLIAARASADRLQARFRGLEQTLAALSGNPQLFDDPASAAAGEVLAGSLLGNSQLAVAVTIFRTQGEDVLVQRARAPDAPELSLDAMSGLPEAARLFRQHEETLLGARRETGRPGLFVAVASRADDVADILNPLELGDSAQLLLLEGRTVWPLSDEPVHLPDSLLAAIAQPQVRAQAIRSDELGALTVGAFARIGESEWSVVSLQPADRAEAAAAEMRRAAWIALAAVVLVVAALGLLAWRRVIEPVRSLLAVHRDFIPGGAEGSDLSQLQQAFTQIKSYQRNREAFKEVFLGRYKLLSTLGQGAMGSVFLAWDPKLKRHVAIKTIHVDAPDDRLQKALARTLENEAVAVANLHHANIVSVFDLVAAGQFGFVVMEYVEGGNLRQIVSRHGSLSPPEVVLIAQSLLKALDAAHRAGLLHLDIKPGNVLVPPEGELRLTDFGVAAWRFEVADLVSRGGLAGTPGFIAPEYVNGAAPTERSDLYSMGKLLVECVTGAAQHLPGARTNDLRRAAQRPVELDARLKRDAPELCAAIEQLCALDPAQRPPNARDALALFAALATDGAAEALAQRATVLIREQSLDVDLTGEATTAPVRAGDTTRKLSLADTLPDADASDVTRPPPGARASAATLPPPVYDPDQTRPPPDA
ncbi:MAG: serine/threonine protein kinase [Xanthomonadales bacterium]|nr:serine/threonine protein kinase [Xanthomonadales bacterium]